MQKGRECIWPSHTKKLRDNNPSLSKINDDDDNDDDNSQQSQSLEHYHQDTPEIHRAKKRARDREKDQNKPQKKDHFGGCRKM